MRKAPEYSKVTGHLTGRTTNAVKILFPSGSEHWIPRSLVWGPDDITINNLPYDTRVSIRIMSWKAEELSL